MGDLDANEDEEMFHANIENVERRQMPKRNCAKQSVLEKNSSFEDSFEKDIDDILGGEDEDFGSDDGLDLDDY